MVGAPQGGELFNPIIAIIGATVVIIIAIVTASVWISTKITKAQTEIDNLKDRVKRVEDEMTYMYRLDFEESRKAAERVRRKLAKEKTAGEEDED
jgi:uncharacterized membrane protein (DUF106 family)